MELRTTPYPPAIINCLPSCLPRGSSSAKPFLHGRAFKLPSSKTHPDTRNLSLLHCRALASGTSKSSLVELKAVPNEVDKDKNLVFVAGATGRVGSRTVRELLKLGFRVRGAVRNTQRAESLVQSVQQMKLDVGTAVEGAPPSERLQIVECDLEKLDQIGTAIGKASIIICCIGASEKEVFDVTGPYRIDYLATKNLIDMATIAKVNHFILLTSLGTNKIGFPAAILNLFWGVLIWKRKAEEALLASGLPYTIVRPGGMERPTDAYKETHNITLSEEDTLFGGQVSNLQVAELMAFVAKSRKLSYCKIVEVVAEMTVPLTPMGELLAKIPSQRADACAIMESDAGALPDLDFPINVSSEAPSTSTENYPAQTKAVTSTPLSPYTVYGDLKPPASPCPNPPVGGKKYDPTVMVSKSSILDTQTSTYERLTVNDKVPTSVELRKTQPLSPYAAYADLKPPTSPSPSVPSVTHTAPSPTDMSHMTAISSSSTESQRANTLPEKVHAAASKPRAGALSPFTMYEDLKPPTSPTPTKS